MMLFAAPVSAQWSYFFGLKQEFNDNPFHFPMSEETWISTLEIGIERQFAQFGAGYYGTVSRFDRMSERDFYLHQLATWTGSDTTSWGAYFEQRLNREDFNIFDYKELKLFFSHRFNISDVAGTGSGNIQYNGYDQFSDLNNVKLNIGVRFNKSFPTKTTFIAGAYIDYKNYLNPSSESDFLPDSLMMMIPNYSVPPVNNTGMGGPASNRGGRGYQPNRGRGYFVQHAYADFENSSVAQLSTYFRLAQSITATTGLAVHYNNRTLISGDDRYISGISDSYSRESEIFNDPLGYQSHSIDAELTKLLPLDMTLKMSAFSTSKKYSSQGIYSDEENYDTDVLRKDHYHSLFLSLKKTFDFDYWGGGLMSINLYFQWIENQSNSYWYDYRNRLGSIQFRFEF
ncbi:MAG TPA: hypothetical protein ENN22_14080 [bacterium]|nr:hypothetical protein [bacterium]